MGETCEVGDCAEPVHAKKRCQRHYMRDYQRTARGSEPRVVLADSCVEEGCDEPVRAKDRCARHYFANYARERGRVNGGHHRPPLDGTVYKLRYRRADGASNTTYYSDPKLADNAAVEMAESGTLIYFGRYTLDEEMTSNV